MYIVQFVCIYYYSQITCGVLIDQQAKKYSCLKSLEAHIIQNEY